MNWDDLRYFLALCREGSVSAAGRALQVNHTTVARRITALEQALSTRLFDRTAEGYAMTQAAENMYADALRMEERAQAIDRAMFGRDAELQGRLRLTVPYDFANAVLMPKLVEFGRTYPQIELTLLTTTLLMDLAAREADVAVRLTAKPPEYLVGRRVLSLRHGIYGTPEQLSKPDAVSVVLYTQGDERPDWLRRHFPRASVALRTDTAASMLAAVKCGLGIARMPCFLADQDPELRRLDVELAPSDWGIWVLSHVDLRSTARVRVCREFMIETIESQRALISGARSKLY